jgi:RHS repeat-associated protein
MKAAYLQGGQGVIKSLVNNVYYYQDKLGSTTHVADGSGQLLESYRYDLYGTPTYYDQNGQLKANQVSGYGVNDLFAGERWIGELALYDLRNRFMSPELGRFLQADPIGFKGDASNLYGADDGSVGEQLEAIKQQEYGPQGHDHHPIGEGT